MVIRNLHGDEPELLSAIEGYKKTWALPETAAPQAAEWLGVYEGDKLLVVCGERTINKAVEITDMYVVPGAGFAAKKAVVSLVKMYRQTLEVGYNKSLIATCLYRNKMIQKCIEKAFGVPPVAVVYMAESHA